MESLEEVQSKAEDPICSVAKLVNTESLEEVQSEAQDPICGVARLVNTESLEEVQSEAQDPIKYTINDREESDKWFYPSENIHVQRHDILLY